MTRVCACESKTRQKKSKPYIFFSFPWGRLRSCTVRFIHTWSHLAWDLSSSDNFKTAGAQWPSHPIQMVQIREKDRRNTLTLWETERVTAFHPRCVSFPMTHDFTPHWQNSRLLLLLWKKTELLQSRLIYMHSKILHKLNWDQTCITVQVCVGSDRLLSHGVL